MSGYQVFGICGSLRAGSYNRWLLAAAKELVPAGMEISIYSELRDLPHYDGDLDTRATRPAVAEELRRLVGGADGLLIATPEYSTSIPGVLKNALDWVGSDLRDESMPLRGKAVALTGASPGPFGSVRAQHALRSVLHSTGSVVVARPEVAVYACQGRFDESGELTDSGTEQLLGELLRSLMQIIDRQRGEHALVSAASASDQKGITDE
jgi:chromate reductase